MEHSSTPAPEGFTAFWKAALADEEGGPALLGCTPQDTRILPTQTYDIEVSGTGGAPVHGWLHLPRDRDRPLPVVVQLNPYGSGRGHPLTPSHWALAGYAHLTMDTRGQGGNGTPGVTPDPVGGSGAEATGFLTRGISDIRTAYYRRVVIDCVRVLQAVREHPELDRDRVFLTGRSQGGGLALITASLVTDVTGVMADVPFLCDILEGARTAENGPYLELVSYLRTHPEEYVRATTTLAHLDATVHVPTARAPALFSVAMRDTVCPPATVLAAYSAYGGPKELVRLEFHGHEGGGWPHEQRKLDWVASLLNRV